MRSMLVEGIDIAIRFDPRQYLDLHARPLMDEVIMPVATPEYLSQHPGFASGQSRDG